MGVSFLHPGVVLDDVLELLPDLQTGSK
jgi:hypothetical protein